MATKAPSKNSLDHWRPPTKGIDMDIPRNVVHGSATAFVGRGTAAQVTIFLEEIGVSDIEE